MSPGIRVLIDAEQDVSTRVVLLLQLLGAGELTADEVTLELPWIIHGQ